MTKPSDISEAARRFLYWLYVYIEPREEEIRRSPAPAQFKCWQRIRYPEYDTPGFLNTGASLKRKGLVSHDPERQRIGLFPWHLTPSGRALASLLELA